MLRSAGSSSTTRIISSCFTATSATLGLFRREDKPAMPASPADSESFTSGRICWESRYVVRPQLPPSISSKTALLSAFVTITQIDMRSLLSCSSAVPAAPPQNARWEPRRCAKWGSRLARTTAFSKSLVPSLIWMSFGSSHFEFGLGPLG